MKKFQSVLLIFVFFFASLSFAADETVVIGESEVLEYILSTAPESRIAMEDLGIYEAYFMTSKSVFDTYFTAEANHTRDELRRSSTFFGDRQDVTNWNLGLAKELPFGTSTSVEWTNQRSKAFNTATINGVSIFPTDATYETTAIFSISQPLLKNFGGMNDRASVKQSKRALESMDASTKYRVANVAYQGLLLYWQWMIASENISAWEQSVADAQNFLNITKNKKKLGTAEETDLLAAEANHITRQNGLANARKTLGQIEKSLRVTLGLSPNVTLIQKNKDLRKIHDIIPDLDDALNAAFSKRWDYIAYKKELEMQNIKVVSSQNKRWPELDLVGSLSLNELDSSYSDTWKGTNKNAWTVGMNLSIPLENRFARAEYKQAKHEKAKSLIKLKQLENGISNSINEILNRLNANIEILRNAEKTESLQRKKLTAELNKYKLGRSTSELIVRYQDDRLNSQQGTLNAWADYYMAVLDLKLAENNLIDL